MSALKVFVADESALMRATIRELLASDEFAIVGDGATVQACIEGIRATRPQVVVLDGQIGGDAGVSVLRAVRTLQGLAVVVFTNHASPLHRRRFLAEGAHSVLDKNADFEGLADTLREAAKGLRDPLGNF